MKNIGKLGAILFSVLIIIALAIPYSVSAADQTNYPASINGLPVILIETSANDVSLPSGQTILVLLDTVSSTTEKSLARLSLPSYLSSNPLSPNWSFEVYGGSGISKDEILKVQKENNDWQKQHGVIKLGPIQNGISLLNTAGPFQVDWFNDPQTQTLTYQSVSIPAPTITGSYEDAYAYFGNNVMTNSNYFLQSGQIYCNAPNPNGGTRLIWADTTINTSVQNFSLTYYGGHNYQHDIFYDNPTTWVMSVRDRGSGFYAYHIETQAQGTKLKYDINTSVFFENYNTHANWYFGFNSGTVSGYGALTGSGSGSGGYYGGTSWPWASDTLYQNYIRQAMSGSLSNSGTTQWLLNRIPLGSP